MIMIKEIAQSSQYYMIIFYTIFIHIIANFFYHEYYDYNKGKWTYYYDEDYYYYENYNNYPCQESLI